MRTVGGRLMEMSNSKISIAVVTEFWLLICLIVTSTVSGCGPLLPGQERVLRFSMSGFTLALPMVYVEDPARSLFPSVQRNAMQAETFVRNLLIGAMNDVLEQQGRNAGLPFEVISLILNQLTLNVTYTPLKCFSASPVDQMAPRMNNMDNCLVASDTVTSICSMMAVADCGMAANLRPVPQQHLTITATLRIGNFIMASWSNQMWRSILNRELRVLSSGPFSTNFQAASVDIV